MTQTESRFRLGPGVFVTAAFIGPGTLMTASRAGAQFGFALVWAVVFSVFTAIVLQEMAARLGIVSGNGLAEAIRSGFKNVVIRWLAIVLILGAILFGNSAYQTGNILGAAAGLEMLTAVSATIWAVVIAVLATIVIWIGRFDVLQWLLTALVALMGLVFVFSAILCGPNVMEIVAGLKPAIPEGSEWAVIGLIGTTVVPYNLFLHASSSASRYSDLDDKRMASRHSLFDTVISIVVGGVITLSLLITAAVAFDESQLSSVKDIANQLKPGLGAWAEKWFAVGLFAAGLTSSITAPVAAGYATAGCFGWQAKLSNVKLKLVATLVVAVGLAVVLIFGIGSKDSTVVSIIILAQVFNGLLLPVVAVFLIYTLNRTDLLGDLKNRWFANLLAAVVLLVTVAIAAQQFKSVWSKLSELIWIT